MNIIPFDFNDNMVRVVEQDNEFYFIAKDIATILDYSDAEAMTRKLDEDEVQNRQIVGFGNRGVSCITESGLYSCILTSQKPEAKPFRRWVTHEVLPTIRKTGSYTKGFFPEQDEFESDTVADIAPKKYYDADGKEIPDPENHRYKLPDTISPSWIKCIVELYGKRVAGNYFAQHLGVPQEVLALPKVEFVAVEPEMKEFVDECIFRSAEEKVAASALFEAYRQWGGSISKNNFGKEFQKYTRLESRVYNIDGQSVRCYDGVTLRDI